MRALCEWTSGENDRLKSFFYSHIVIIDVDEDTGVCSVLRESTNLYVSGLIKLGESGFLAGDADVEFFK